MDVKDWLARGRVAKLEIQALLAARQEAFRLACLPALGNGERVQVSRENRQEDKMVALVSLEEEIDRRVENLYKILEEISRAVADVEDPSHRILLTERYINFKTWEQVADSMGYDLRWVYRLHKKAVDAIAERWQ
ncbi:MAG: DUF1492 domain-containing protein [Clostridia bacterium]|nr:DUF1492 domain-containing protein [Clostridia bacterium]